MFWFLVAKLYAQLSWPLSGRFPWRGRGLGRVLRRVGLDTVVWVHGAPLYFDHRVGPCYHWHLSGEWNEPETHAFLRAVVNAVNSPVRFVDVGASVGEMVVDVARLKNVCEVIAFEPNPVCARAVKISALLGDLGQVKVIERVVKDSATTVSFLMKPQNPGIAGIALNGELGGVILQATTLDAELGGGSDPTIVLIDVEGAELLVMRGGREFIRRARPLVIFEYIAPSRPGFTLDEVRLELGCDYEIFRLGPGGLLDGNLENTWNCVAVERSSVFYEPCMTLLRP